MDMKGIEKACSDVCDDNTNMLIPWYIMAAYAYYVDDNPIMEDTTFDRLTKKLLTHWDSVEHTHKEFLNKDMLEAGTFLGDYPSRTKGAVDAIRQTYR
jgi:hypothetical protein